MITLTYWEDKSAKDVKPLVVQIPDERDPFAVCARCEAKLGLKPDDARWERWLMRQKQEAEQPPREAEIDAGARARAREPLPQQVPIDVEGVPSIGTSSTPLLNAEGRDTNVEVVAHSKASGVRDTSRAAYRALQFSGKLAAQQQEIVNLFLSFPTRTWTRQEIASALGLGINTVCGRANELMKEPFEVLVELEERRACAITKNRVTALKLAEGS